MMEEVLFFAVFVLGLSVFFFWMVDMINKDIAKLERKFKREIRYLKVDISSLETLVLNDG